MNGKPPQGWRKMIAGEADEFRKADILRGVADASKSDSELADVLKWRWAHQKKETLHGLC